VSYFVSVLSVRLFVSDPFVLYLFCLRVSVQLLYYCINSLAFEFSESDGYEGIHGDSALVTEMPKVCVYWNWQLPLI